MVCACVLQFESILDAFGSAFEGDFDNFVCGKVQSESFRVPSSCVLMVVSM